MINYAIPGLYSHFDLNIRLIQLLKNHPEYFYDNINIDAVYGIFPFCIFDGGRTFLKYNQTCKEDIDKILKTYEKYNIPIRLILTNSQLKENDYYDHFGNIILSMCEKNGNQIVCSDDNFKNYIKEHYPKYSFISSTTKCLNKKQFQEELKQMDYFEICLDYNLNKNFILLESLSAEQKEKCEFLINAICPPGCPTRKEHYKLNSLFYLGYGNTYHVPACQIDSNTLNPKTCNYSNNISLEEIQNKYEPMGFSHFKLEGRSLSRIEMACNYVKYMIKPEYQFFVLSILVENR